MDMIDKGYPFPLFSLDLVPPGSAPEDDPRYAIPAGGGLLTVPAALRRRAADISSAACQEAVAVALTHHRVALPQFSAHGLTEAWAMSLRHWAERLRQHEARRHRLAQESADHLTLQRGTVAQVRELWGRLRLASELAGIGGAIVAGPAPRGELHLIDALPGVLTRLSGLADRLAGSGFPQPLIDQLGQAAAYLPQARQQTEALARARQHESDLIVAVRAALLGDISRLCKVAPHVLLPHERRPLVVERLFGLRRRRRAREA
jgi:hypothetical protein